MKRGAHKFFCAYFLAFSLAACSQSSEPPATPQVISTSSATASASAPNSTPPASPTPEATDPWILSIVGEYGPVSTITDDGFQPLIPDHQPVTLNPTYDEAAADVKNTLYAQQQNVDGPVIVAVVNLMEPLNDGLNAKAPFVAVQVFDATGKTLSKFELPSSSFPSSGGIYGKTLVLTTNAEGDASVYGFDIDTGKQMWALPTVYATNCPNVPLSKDRFVACFGKEVRAVNSQTGATVWSRTFEENPVPRSLPGATALLVSQNAGGGVSGSVLNAASGQVVASKVGDSVGDPKTGMIAVKLQADPNVSMRVFNADGSVAYALSKAAEEELGTVVLLGMYDGRIWVKSNQGISIVNATTGASDPLSPRFGTTDVGYGTAVRVPVAGSSNMTILATLWRCLSGNGVCNGSDSTGGGEKIAVVHPSEQPAAGDLLNIAGPIAGATTSVTPTASPSQSGSR